MPLRTHFAFRLETLGPVNDHPVAGPAIVRSDLLGPAKGRISRHSPSRGIVTVGIRTAQLVVMLQDVLDRFRHAVEIGHLIEHAVHPTLGACPVVADDVEDQRIVQLPHVLDSFNQPPDFRVGIFPESGEYLQCRNQFFSGKERGHRCRIRFTASANRSTSSKVL